jgi:hypothetical protein
VPPSQACPTLAPPTAFALSPPPQEPAKRVLVVGGGDGGVLRELARYPHIEVCADVQQCSLQFTARQHQLHVHWQACFADCWPLLMYSRRVPPACSSFNYLEITPHPLLVGRSRSWPHVLRTLSM